MKHVKIYTTKWCPYCHKALKKLDEKGVKYENINVSEHQETFAAVKQQTGWDTVPQIFIEDKFIGGCDDLLELDANGELDVLLG